jgi:hypothetical protein
MQQEKQEIFSFDVLLFLNTNKVSPGSESQLIIFL